MKQNKYTAPYAYMQMKASNNEIIPSLTERH